MTTTMKSIMTTAWNIARKGSETFGGSSREYFAISLKLAWAESKAPKSIMDMIPELEKMGFSRWTKGNMDRMYINASKLGLHLDHYKTGNVSAAEILGYRVSNAEGRRIYASKTYIDLKDGKLYSTNDWAFEAACVLLGIDKPAGYDRIATVAAAA